MYKLMQKSWKFLAKQKRVEETFYLVDQWYLLPAHTKILAPFIVNLVFFGILQFAAEIPEIFASAKDEMISTDFERVQIFTYHK